jgi:hypothetical protein
MNVSGDGCKVLFVSTQEQTWRQCEISTSYTVRLNPPNLFFTTKQNDDTSGHAGPNVGNRTAVSVTPDASTLKCYSCHVAQQCTCQLQEALLALQARTKNTGHHLPEIKENRRYNLRALGQGIIFINKNNHMTSVPQSGASAT